MPYMLYVLAGNTGTVNTGMQNISYIRAQVLKKVTLGGQYDKKREFFGFLLS